MPFLPAKGITPPPTHPQDFPQAAIISLAVEVHILCSCPQSQVCDIERLADTVKSANSGLERTAAFAICV